MISSRPSPGNDAALGLWDLAWQKDCVPGTDGKLLLAASDDVLARQHVDEFVLLAVHVQGGVEHRLALLKDRDGTVGVIGARQDKDGRAAEGELLRHGPNHKERGVPPLRRGPRSRRAPGVSRCRRRT
jgi:hypothetical protein